MTADREALSALKVGLASDAISQDFETAFLLAQSWGLTAFELKRFCYKRVPDLTQDEVDLLQGFQKKYPLEIVSLSPGAFKEPLTRANVESGFERFERTLALAEALGVRRVIVFGFERDESLPSPLDAVTEVFHRVAERAARDRVSVMIENDRGHWMNDPEILQAVVRRVDSPYLRVNWDPGNLIGVLPADAIRRAHEQMVDIIGHVHVKDAVRTPIGFGHAMLGAGDVDWPFHLKLLTRQRFDGYLVIEPHFGHRITSTREHIEAMLRLLQRPPA